MIDPSLRKRVVVNGTTFTIRPLTGGDRLYIGACDRREMTTTAAIRGTVRIDDPPFPNMTVDQFDADVILKIANEVSIISGLSEDDEKNSVSARGSSSDGSTTPTANASLPQATASANS